MDRQEKLETDTVETKPKRSLGRKWLMIIAVAVNCVGLLAGIFGVIHRQRYGPDQKTIGEISVDLDQLSYDIPDSPYIDLSQLVGMLDYKEEFHPTKQFGQTMSVHAKIVEILPDTYCFFNGYGRIGRTAYRILRLRVLDTIVGSNMPTQIYYLLPAYLSMDLMEYDSFIITVRQVGVENYAMVNATQQTLEAFTLLFEPWSVDACWGSVMAFSDGVLDPPYGIKRAGTMSGTRCCPGSLRTVRKSIQVSWAGMLRIPKLRFWMSLRWQEKNTDMAG